MKNTLLVILITALLGGGIAEAQLGRQMSLSNSPAYEGAAASLRGAPSRPYNFSKAVLSDVMRLMAEDAGIGFFGLPDGVGGTDKLVTFTITASPFVALETLAKANGIALIYESGIWYLRPANDQELIGRIYEINYNAQELVTKSSSGGGTSGSSTSSGAGSGSSGGLSLQGSPDFFVTEPSRILEDIQNLLSIPTTGSGATFAPTTSVDSISSLPIPIGNFQQGSGGSIQSGDSTDSGAGSAKVIWNSDSNTLYVIATRQQHQWIEAYLASADRPQAMIAVEVKFLETSRDPSSDFGIDWDGALGSSGLEANLSGASGPANLASLGGYSLPTAVLSYSDLNLKLRSIYNDSRTRSVSYPRMVTLDNREVSFRSVVNQPVLGSSASTSLGAGATETSSIEYLPIGTVINVLPKRMAGDKILLNVSVTVSDIIGTEVINGNPFPIATSRVYTAPLTVKSGYTVAISGLDAARTSEAERGVPVLGKLPILGNAFRRKQKDRSRQHLMMLITPVSMDGGTNGLTKKPIIKEPWATGPADYSKSPLYDGPARTNKDLPAHRDEKAYEVSDVPDFTAVPVSRKTSQTFGMKSEASTEPMVANADDRQVGSNSSMIKTAPLPTADPANTPMIVDAPMAQAMPVDEAPEKEMPKAAPAPAPAPAADQTPAPAPAVAKADATPEPEKAVTLEDAPEVDSGKVSELKSSVGKLVEQIDAIPGGEGKLSPDDAQIVSNAYDESQKLLSEVDKVRGDKSRPLQGDLGDVWWDLINLKTKVVKLGRRSPESLALKEGE
ncbi:hypothetical protein VSU19_08430 [Verrucomicrobiales bacterium BCK34]|nr:hypothetical protein [Verrucomicrobiales bacterium BCK34]